MKKKLTAIFLCVALVAIAVAGATLAYFTDETAKVENTFSLGNVKITLTEPAWDKEGDHTLYPGKTFDKDPTITLTDKSMDSYVFLKMEITNYKELAYIMAADASKQNVKGYKMPDNFSAANFWAMYQGNDKATFQEILGRWFTGIKHWDWEVLNVEQDEQQDVLTLTMAYIGGDTTNGVANGPVVKAKQQIVFMTKFGMPATVEQEMIETAKLTGTVNMNFTAYAVQKEGFDSPSAAWTATFGKPATENP